MGEREIIAPIGNLEDLIHEIREQKVVLDADRAALTTSRHVVSTKRSNVTATDSPAISHSS
jgi:hypothetical protein